MSKSVSVRRIRAARVLALLADAVQIVAFPTFFNPILEPLNLAFDTVMALVFMALVGWHWAFLPAFVSEAIPIFDLVPSWTAAVFLATRGAASDGGSPTARTVVPEVTVIPPARPEGGGEERR